MDENIIDSKYCISFDNQYHCFWLLDKHYTVWKCFSEKNIKESNWTLAKYSFNSYSPLNLFFKPVMTYIDYYMLSCLQKIQCIHKLTKVSGNKEFMVAFNGSATKMIIVKQNELKNEIKNFD